MKKIVNIKPTLPIYTLRTPITGPVFNCEMSDGDILNCICARALVDEVLCDGTTIRLNLTNYNKDNEPKSIKIEEVVTPLILDSKEAKLEEIKIEDSVPEEIKKEEDVVEETTVEKSKEKQEYNKKNKKKK